MNSNEKRGNMRRRVAAAAGRGNVKGNHPNSIEANAGPEQRRMIAIGRINSEHEQRLMNQWAQADFQVRG